MRQTYFPPSLWPGFNRLQGEVNRLWQPWADTPERPATFALPVNVWEDAEAFHVEAELPGVPQDKVEVFVSDRNLLTLQGEHPAGDAGGTWHCRERGSGHFERV